eukprot:7528520-Pyramimonas_sp.AAC.1
MFNTLFQKSAGATKTEGAWIVHATHATTQRNATVQIEALGWRGQKRWLQSVNKRASAWTNPV